ncbi:MAG: pyruvate formate-lyase-activating protein [Francisellaceae bacterium]
MSQDNSVIEGRIHSTESCGTVDGPGIRFIVFTQGCALRCLYCHNPDCQAIDQGKAISVDEIMTEIRKYKTYMRLSGGGVTVSGGEPSLQPQFVCEIFKRCHDEGIHTALDTSGCMSLSIARKVTEFADLILLDIKAFDSNVYYQLTHAPLEPTLRFASYLNQLKKPMWIRYVLVPGINDNLNDIARMADYLAQFSNIDRIEVLPFHKLGEYKWKELKMEYKLSNTEPPSADLVEKVERIFSRINTLQSA